MHNVNRWAKIFETEKEDRTNRKHTCRKHIKEIVPYLNEIAKISIFLEKKGEQTFASVSPSTLKVKLNQNFHRTKLKQNFH